MPSALSAACSRSPRESQSQTIFVLTGLSDESPRRPGPLAALLRQSRPRGATWRPAKTHSARRLIHFRDWESGWVNLNCAHAGWLTPVRFFIFFIFYLAYQEINAWNQTEWEFHFISYSCDRLDLLWLLSEMSFGTANSCNLGLAKGIMGLF